MNEWGKWILCTVAAVILVLWLMAQKQTKTMKAFHELDREQNEFNTKMEDLNRRVKNMKPGDL